MSTRNNYEKFQEAKCDLGLTDIVNAFGYIQVLIKYLPEDSRLHEYYDEVIEPLKKFVKDCSTDKQCPKCGRNLYLSDVEGYEYVCTYCDENFYECEVK
jgi:hypothetical protein